MISEQELNLKYITDKNGNKKEVILSLEKFEELLQDLEDLSIAAERKNEESISHDEVKKALKGDGLLIR